MGFVLFVFCSCFMMWYWGCFVSVNGDVVFGLWKGVEGVEYVGVVRFKRIVVIVLFVFVFFVLVLGVSGNVFSDVVYGVNMFVVREVVILRWLLGGVLEFSYCFYYFYYSF